MYFFYENKSGILQVGFQPLSHSGLLHGVWVSETFFYEELILCYDDIRILNLNKNFFQNHFKNLNHFRFHINNRLIKNILLISIGLIFLLIKFYFKIKDNSVFLNLRKYKFIYAIMPLLLIKFFSVFYVEKNENLDISNEFFSQGKILSLFSKTDLSKNISDHRNDFYSGKTLSVKNIREFYVVPIKNGIEVENKSDVYHGFIAVAYKRIISVQSDKKSYSKNPDFICNKNEDSEISIFRISQMDTVLFLENGYKLKSNNSNIFYTFPINYFEKSNICDYFNKKNLYEF